MKERKPSDHSCTPVAYRAAANCLCWIHQTDTPTWL